MKYLVCLLILLLSIGCYKNIEAADVKPQALDKQEDSVIIDDLEKGSPFKSDKYTYQFLPELYSVAGERKTSSNMAASFNRIHESKAGSLLSTRGSFSIYRSGIFKQTAMSLETAVSTRLYPVVLNTRTGRLGIVTGTLVVKLNNLADAYPLADAYGLTLKKTYARLNLALFSTSAGQDILKAQQVLEADEKTTDVTIEVLETFRKPH